MFHVTKTSSLYFMICGLLCGSFSTPSYAAHQNDEDAAFIEPDESETIMVEPQERQRFTCPVDGCLASYTRRWDLKQHMTKKHIEDASDHREIFERKKSSKKGKRWPCPLKSCPSGYTKKGDLKRHVLLKHPQHAHLYPTITRGMHTKKGKTHPCSVPSCECGYMRAWDLKQHMQTKHADWFALILEAAQEIEPLEASSPRKNALSHLLIPSETAPHIIKPTDFFPND